MDKIIIKAHGNSQKIGYLYALTLAINLITNNYIDQIKVKLNLINTQNS
jgi:fatty acid/phospholipid biosynthesis enzyme